MLKRGLTGWVPLPFYKNPGGGEGGSSHRSLLGPSSVSLVMSSDRESFRGALEGWRERQESRVQAGLSRVASGFVFTVTSGTETRKEGDEHPKPNPGRPPGGARVVEG